MKSALLSVTIASVLGGLFIASVEYVLTHEGALVGAILAGVL